MSKTLQKVIINLSRLLNKFRKEKITSGRSAYKKQKHLCRTTRKEKKRTLQ